MDYIKFKTADFWKNIQTEEDARNFLWQSRFEGLPFKCPHCGYVEYYQYRCRPEIRKCRKCLRQVRLRAGTIFENSKLSIMTWVRGLYSMMQGKRGISAVEVQKQIEVGSYFTAWGLLHKIREGLRQRDEIYKLKGVVELDGAQFGKRRKYEQITVLVAVESRDWIDERGRLKTKAGFAKVMMTRESARCAQKFVDRILEPEALINTDGNNSYTKLRRFDVDYQVVDGDPEILNRWLPWVHKFVSNAKTWILGTHHGVGRRNVGRYLSEYAYRFNRRHDPYSLFHRALTACALARPITLSTLHEVT